MFFILLAFFFIRTQPAEHLLFALHNLLLLCDAKISFCTAKIYFCTKHIFASNPFLSLPVLSHVGGTPNIFLHQKQTKIQHVLTVIKRPTKNISALFTFFACNVFIFYILFAAFLKVCLTCILIL